MSFDPHEPPVRARTCALLSAGILGRTALALVALGFLTLPVLAAGPERPVLRGDITARRDVITLGDLVSGAPAELAERPLFRAPALGATGTIQVRRIMEAAAHLGVEPPESGGRLQVTVQRAARRIAAPEIEAALREALARLRGLDAASLSVAFDGEAPVLTVPVDLDAPAHAAEVTYDPRSRRVSGLVTVGERQASLRVSGQVIEMVEVAVLARPLARGETVGPQDVTLERRPRDAAPPDGVADAASLVGQVAQRALAPGQPLRSADLARPDLVQRGEAVTILYEGPGVSLALGGLAREGGPLGATVSVVNPVSKKVLQGTVVGPGRVSVGPAPRPASLAAALPARP
ncbi:flagella basal body P-ring formation protein FlgA [Methylobacterium sp. 4-46]|uniref:flagellar basal body P-ring formation chaperone FlgA n=1 Tax=unclassified Methylobacterium TaxID=2615210 RepID=UPI000152C101|nr:MULTISPECIES: flagellar basal body P-ring formation chaperone FlgA [Methylobacterium]ACA18545.1 flagella basal body P-ring formation protein FlgA [Methylobacterium sp. 4-46]WFT77830.1 flagellar basal body P-ring formation chaperone FlgA [Methylobacterium nodulans]